jgi:hypothetical protein
MKKFAIAAAALGGTLVLTACQSNTQVQQPKHERMMKHHQDARMMKHHDGRMAKHQRGMHQANKACESKKAGESVSLTAGQRTINGSCEMVFMPERGQKALKSNYKTKTDVKAITPRNSVMTDAERAEMVKQFDLRLAERQAKQKAIQTACQGQSVGKAVQIKFAEQTVQGQCQLKFKPQAKAA